MRDNYTRYPRAILWLVRGGVATIDGAERPVEPFYLSKLPITNVQFEAYEAAFERDVSSPADDDAAVGVDFDRARGYCEWYAGVSRKPMRLPSEIEWEYACRAGASSRYFFGDRADADRHVWHAGNSGEAIPPLREARPNSFGLHAMLGGVWEWTAEGVLRGGSYRTPLDGIGCDVRRACAPGYRASDVGFRIARSLK